MKIVIVGGGAIDRLFGYFLVKGGNEITLIDNDPKTLGALQEKGIGLISESCPLLCMQTGFGNILLYILGRKNFRPVDVLSNPEIGEKVSATLNDNDLSLLSRDRVFNLKKLYPSLPKCFNDILLHFSSGTNVMYDTATEFYDDLAASIQQV